MILKEQEILKFDTVDNQKMLIPSSVKNNDLKSEYNLTYDFKNKIIGKVKDIKVRNKSLIGDIEIKNPVIHPYLNLKTMIDDSLFRPAFKTIETKNGCGITVVRDLELLYISMIQKEKDVYN